MTDRGQWNMAKNLILKYGLIPYRAMPDPFHQKSLVDLNVSANIEVNFSSLARNVTKICFICFLLLEVFCKTIISKSRNFVN